MKYLIFYLSVVFLISCCGPVDKKQYDFEIITTNGDTIYTSYVGLGDNLFSLKNGDLTTNNFERTLISGVRSYTVSIKKLGTVEPKSREAFILKEIEIEE